MRDSGYVEAARALGHPYASIVRRHIFPNAMRPLVVVMTLGVGQSIVWASGIAFLGLGVAPPSPEWGALLNAGPQLHHPGLVAGGDAGPGDRRLRPVRHHARPLPPTTPRRRSQSMTARPAEPHRPRRRPDQRPAAGVENLRVGFGERRTGAEVVHGVSFCAARRASAWRSSASPARARASPPAPWSG